MYYALGEAITRALPREAAWAMAKYLSRIYAGIISQDLGAIRSNLRQALPKSVDENELKNVAKRVIENYAYYLVDLFYTEKLSKDFIEAHVEIQGLAYLDDALLKNHGVILASAHLGHWEMGGMTLSKIGYPIHAIAIKHQDPRIEEIFQRRRRHNGLRIIHLGISIRECYKVLRENEILAINADRLFSEDGIPVKFMNKMTYFPEGISRFSLFTGAAVIPTFFIMKHRGRYLLDIQPPLEESGPESLTQAFAARLEEEIKRYPDQWFIFQAFWKPPQWPL